MIINDKRNLNNVSKVGDVQMGTVFYYGLVYYLKTNNVFVKYSDGSIGEKNCINLCAGNACYINQDSIAVIFPNSELTIKD